MKRQIIPIFMDGDTPSPTPTDNYAVNLSMSMDSNYIISAQLIDQDGNVLGDRQQIDLPLESVVVGGSYDSNTKSIILTLDNGNTITIPVADLVSGLQPTIDANNKLNADYIADGQTNKVFTASDKQSLMDAISATSNLGTMAYQDASNYTPSASLSSVATSGSYNDLTNKPDLSIYAQSASLSTVATSGDYDDLVNKPNLAPVATSGSYNDLTNKPQIPAAQVNSDWSANSGVSEILNKPDLSIYAESANLASVATTGDYSDLSNTPTIPTVNDATITLTQGGVTKGTFTLNQNQNATIDFSQSSSTVDWSDISNKPSFATVATSGDYDDLTDKPTLGTMAAESASDYTPTASLATVATSGSYTDLSNTPSLATVATSGSYADLSNKPDLSIYAQSANLSTVATSGSYNDLSNKPDLSGYRNVIEMFDLSQSELVNFYNNYETLMTQNLYVIDGYTFSVSPYPYEYQQGVNLLVFAYNISATTLNPDPDARCGLTMNAKAAYLAPNGILQRDADFERLLVTTDCISTVAYTGSYNDLSNTPTLGTMAYQSVGDYTPTASLGSMAFANTSDYTTTSSLAAVATSGDYLDLSNTPSLATVATSGSYNDLSNKPTIPAAQVNSDWTANSGVSQILNKPNLATVATSGSYTDLTNTPTIPTIPTNVSAFTNDANYATESYVNTAISNIPSPMIFKGSLGTGGTITTLPAASSANEGFTYKVITDGTYDSQSAKVGDMFISDGTNWVYIPSADEPSGTVTSVGLTVPTGLSVSGSPITSSGTLAISLASGYSIPTTTKQSEWDAKSTFSGSYTDLTNKPDLTIYPTLSGNNTFSGNNGFNYISLGDYSSDIIEITDNTIYGYSDTSYKTFSLELSNGLTIGDTSVGDYNFFNINMDTNGDTAITSDCGDINISATNVTVNGNNIVTDDQLATVATSGSYTDLTNKPSIPAAQVNSDWDAVSGVSQILNKPTLATVATSGSYADLSNKPTIPAAQIQSDWTQTTTTALDYIKNKPNLATVATSGSYNDLSNKPTIPTVNNAALSIKKDSGTKVDIYSANASTAETINLVGGTNVSLTEDTSTANTYKMTIAHSTPTGATTKTSGFYKFSTDSQGHVNGTTAVQASDITSLVTIPSNTQTLTFVDGQGNTTTITFYTTA